MKFNFTFSVVVFLLIPIVFFQDLWGYQVKTTLQCNSNVLFTLYNFF